MKKILLILVVLAVCGLGFFMFSQQTVPSDKEADAGTSFIFSANMPQLAETAALQPGESTEIEVTEELREYYFGLARTQAWCYLPEFDEGEPPTDPLEYWLLIELDGIVGWDEYGYYIIESPWREVDENSPAGYGSSGMSVLSIAEMDEWVGSHFAGAQVKHDFYDYHKGYDFDGETYYGVVDCSFPVLYWGLEELSAENVDGRIVYTAKLNEYYFNEYSYFYLDENLSPEENRAALAEYAANAEYGEDLIYDVYGEQLLNGEIRMDEAIRQMVISGRTEGFSYSTTQLEVKYYLSEQTGEPVYLAAHWPLTEE